MVSIRPAGRRTGRAAALVLIAALAAAGTAHAGLSEACRVPDVYLTLPTLERTEKLVDRKSPVKMALLGPALDGSATPLKLERELERRLPGVKFSLAEQRSVTGLAGDDFEDVRRLVDEASPDLLIWQVGGADAQALSDLGRFEAILDAATQWIDARGIDLILIDPPFVPHVRHERVYRPYVGIIGELAGEDVPVLKRYAATQLWSIEREKKRQPQGSNGRCTTEILAEAVTKAITR